MCSVWNLLGVTEVDSGILEDKLLSIRLRRVNGDFNYEDSNSHNPTAHQFFFFKFWLRDLQWSLHRMCLSLSSEPFQGYKFCHSQPKQMSVMQLQTSQQCQPADGGSERQYGTKLPAYDRKMQGDDLLHLFDGEMSQQAEGERLSVQLTGLCVRQPETTR